MEQQNKGKLILTRKKDYIFSLLLDEKGRAVQINLDGGKNESIIGNIYIGRVDNIVRNINAAFIEYAPGQMGYFQLESRFEPIFTAPNRKKGPVRKGDKLMVQVSKDGIKTKEPVLSSDINLTGKYVVLTVGEKGLRFSAKFKDPDKKKHLQKNYDSDKYQDIGFIIRTNALYADEQTVYDEMEFYYSIWQALTECAASGNCLTQIYTAPSPYIVNIRDGYENLIGEILTDDEVIYEEVREYLEKYQPWDAKKLRLYASNDNVSLQAMFNVEKQIREVLQKKVWLKSGAYLVIEPTEALVAIDVNTGKYISEKKAEDEYLKVNLEAAREIARQIRLRNLSGVIIIDFINMKSEVHKSILMDYLKNQLQFDPVNTNIVDMTKLNLVEVTRKKIRKPLYELIDLTILQ